MAGKIDKDAKARAVTDQFLSLFLGPDQDKDVATMTTEDLEAQVLRLQQIKDSFRDGLHNQAMVYQAELDRRARARLDARAAASAGHSVKVIS